MWTSGILEVSSTYSFKSLMVIDFADDKWFFSVSEILNLKFRKHCTSFIEFLFKILIILKSFFEFYFYSYIFRHSEHKHNLPSYISYIITLYVMGKCNKWFLNLFSCFLAEYFSPLAFV